MPNAKVKLLVVDDDVPLRMSLSELFTEYGHSVRSAADGLSALVEIENEIRTSFYPTSTCRGCLDSSCSQWSGVNFRLSG